MVDIETVREVFAKDRFAVAAGIEILEADTGYARCRMEIRDVHRNGMDAVMGGAVYTLADYAFAVASNVGQPATVTMDSAVTFLRGTKGKALYAEARCIKAGGRTCCFDITVKDDLGEEIAVCRNNGMRVGKDSLIPESDEPQTGSTAESGMLQSGDTTGSDAQTGSTAESGTVHSDAAPGYRMAIFDLDGTILSTLEDLTTSVNAALRSCGLPEHTQDEVRSYVGNGFGNLIARSVPEGTSDGERDRVGAAFRAHYAKHSMDQTHPYEGIISLFEKLRACGILVCVLSNKGDSAVQPLMKRFFPGLLDAAYGERPGIRRKPAPDAVNALLAEFGIGQQDAVYIGDSEVDLEVAEAAGLGCISVSWGFRTKEQLQKAGAVVIADSVAELASALLK